MVLFYKGTMYVAYTDVFLTVTFLYPRSEKTNELGRDMKYIFWP